ncbi:MAG: AMP-binding protein [Parvibaculum sp.]|uniref:AMP-binding protein n=1 Tax=Parvibaculum sp. TaxID=2024848 RepID=UPI0025E5CBED|nr:AMP-binding protein [Parvibaculum sp.]MCE9650895.1 AMP-binding protein [Parvibaculum sp.]
MSADFWQVVNDAPDEGPMVLRKGLPLTAHDVRVEARRVQEFLAGATEPVFLYCEDAGNFLAALIGALSAGREVLLPGHAAPGYLREIGAIGARLLTDIDIGDDVRRVSVRTSAQSGPDKVLPFDGGTRVGFFTSGSTGEPKPCMKALRQLASEVNTHLALWGAPQGPVVGTVSHQHIYGLLFRVFWPLFAGRPIVAERQEMWEQVADIAQPDGVIVSSPAHLSRIPDNFSLPHRPALVFSSGGPLSAEAARDASAKLGRDAVEVLGSTETGGVAWRIQREPGAMWTALPGVEIESDSEGALAVRSPFTGASDFMAMGDRVTIASDGRFLLHARLDRTVKIEGKRVSLPRVEGALRGLQDIVDASAVDLPDKGGALGAVVALAPEGARLLDEMGRFRYSRHLRRVLSERLEPMERPRFWRFVVSIPENTQGKRKVADLRALFAASVPDLPNIVSREVGVDEARFDLELMPDLRWFDGHFPGQPILPGVAQLHIASSLAEEAWGIIATGSEMSRIKFRHVMQPGDLVTLMLVRNGADRLDFRYLQGDEVMASGAIKGVEQ